MSSDQAPARHTDSGDWIAWFTGRALVVCPRCGGHSLAMTPPGSAARRCGIGFLFQPRRLVCGACGVVGEWEAERGSRVLLGQPVDPFFRRPLWLRTRCAGHVLCPTRTHRADDGLPGVCLYRVGFLPNAEAARFLAFTSIAGALICYRRVVG